jgi:hypothetical protein
MLSHNHLWRAALFAAVCSILLAGLTFAKMPTSLRQSDEVRHAGTWTGGRTTLDEPTYNQIHYEKTTNFGATWSAMIQAGDLSTFAPTPGSFPDFGSLVMNNNELCFVVGLWTAATPGVYALTGPNFQQPALIMTRGTF